MSGEEEENAAELKIGEEFLKAKCLMNCEVAIILEHKYEQIQQHATESDSQVSQVFEKSLQYVKRFSRYKNPDAVRQVRETLSRYGLAEFELCTIGNLCPDTAARPPRSSPPSSPGGGSPATPATRRSRRCSTTSPSSRSSSSTSSVVCHLLAAMAASCSVLQFP
ncbi:unnamed protein product [Urochloa humidicola]